MSQMGDLHHEKFFSPGSLGRGTLLIMVVNISLACALSQTVITFPPLELQDKRATVNESDNVCLLKFYNLRFLALIDQLILTMQKALMY